jgi:hypothetical protein
MIIIIEILFLLLPQKFKNNFIKNIKSYEKSIIKSSKRKKLDKFNYTNIKNTKNVDNSKSNNNIIKEIAKTNIKINLNDKKDNLKKTDKRYKTKRF